MKIYGAGSIEDIKKCCELGTVGILTNPQGFEQYFNGELTLFEITELIVNSTKEGPIFIQIQGKDTNQLVEKAHLLHSISSRVGFKIIADEKGFGAMRILQSENIQCIATCLFSVAQAALAATVGAYGICPFVSRARHAGIDPFTLIKTIKTGYERLDVAPEIIAVSMKTVADAELSFAAGADSIAVRYPLIKEMMYHILTEKAEQLFAKNWANVKGEDVSYLANYLSATGVAE